jgi:hypothetical protein
MKQLHVFLSVVTFMLLPSIAESDDIAAASHNRKSVLEEAADGFKEAFRVRYIPFNPRNPRVR